MKIAVFGGSFNPVHIGHLVLAEDLCVKLGYDKVLFVPTYIAPHKEMQSQVSARDRLNMVKAFCRSDRRFVAEPCEINRKGVSYTYDTICWLEKKYAGKLDSKIGLVIGSDLQKDFHLWYKAKELSQKAQLILARRPERSYLAKNEFSNAEKGDYGKGTSSDNSELFKNALVIDNPLIDLSSTDIRQRIGTGQSFKYLVPREILKYIYKGHLYGYNS